MKRISHYRNGNAEIALFDDGTRIIDYPDNEKLNVTHPLSMDLKITNWCDRGCPMCHENSNMNGRHSDIMNEKFIDTLLPGTEVALGGGMVTSHPDLEAFLRKLKKRGVFPSITVHQDEFRENREKILEWKKDGLVYGIGVSFKEKDDAFFEELAEVPDAVIHLIAGVHDTDVFDYLSDAKWNFGILILGYKNFRRGQDLYAKEKEAIDGKISRLHESMRRYIRAFRMASFDNLAIEQLDIRGLLGRKEWREFYQGDDGTISMYVDAVNRQFARTSTAEARHALMDDIAEMFNVVKGEKNDEKKWRE